MANKNQEPAETKEVNIFTDPGLQNNWIDNITISSRDDGVCMLRFFTNLPEGAYEKARIFVSRSHLRRIADAISKVLETSGDTDDTPAKAKKKLTGKEGSK